jgi:flagellin-like protein
MRSLKQNKKGVSPIIATLLLIVIAVAAAVVTYAFVSGFIGTATAQSNQQGTMAIDTAAINSNTSITAYLRNTGTKTEVLGTVYVDNQLQTATFNGTSTYSLAPGTVVTVAITGTGTTWQNGVQHVVNIVANDGTPASFNVHS